MRTASSSVLPPLPAPLLVLGAYGYRNAGDEAVLAGLLAELGSATPVTVVSRSPVETTMLHGVPAVGLVGLPRALGRSRSLLIGGGGLFGNGMGRLGQLIAPIGLLAAAGGRRVAITGVGVDADIPIATVAALRLLAPRLAGLGVRDSGSATVLAGWGIEAVVGDDLSEAMVAAPAEEGRALLAAAGIGFDRPIVGLCVSSLGDEAFVLQLEAAIGFLLREVPTVEYCLIPLSQHPFVPGHNDLLLARRLRRASPRLAVLEDTGDPARLVAAFAFLSAVVSTRYHGLRFAARAGVPVVGIGATAKVRHWLAERGQVPTPLSGAHVTHAVRSALERSVQWSA